jgi:hypothetical protein
MKKYSNKRHKKILKLKQKERLRRKNNKKLQKQEYDVADINELDIDELDIDNFDIDNFDIDNFDIDGLAIQPENNVAQIKYNGGSLIIKTPPIIIKNPGIPKTNINTNMSFRFTFDENNIEHNSFLNALSEIDKYASKYASFPKYTYKTTNTG